MRIVLTALIVIALTTSSVRADGPVTAPEPVSPTRLRSAATVETDGGTRLRLSPGFVLVPPDKWEAMDLQVQGLENDRTRLTAENESLKTSLRQSRPPWLWIGTALAAGFAAGAAYGRLE